MSNKKKRKLLMTPLITQDKPKSVISEKFRGIRSNIMFSGADEEVRSVIITSEKPAARKKVSYLQILL